jgi:hypothetical protein
MLTSCLPRSYGQRFLFVLLFLIFVAIFWRTNLSSDSTGIEIVEDDLFATNTACRTMWSAANSSQNDVVTLLSVKYSKFFATHCLKSAGKQKYLIYRSSCSSNCPKLGERLKGIVLMIIAFPFLIFRHHFRFLSRASHQEMFCRRVE